MDNACIIGWGTVGKATGAAFGIEKCYSRSQSTVTLKEAAKCKYVFICLPTPTVNGKCDTKAIEEIIRKLVDYGAHESIFIIRSTVYPGFNRFLQKSLGIKRIVSNPEFLSEDTALNDMLHPDLIVIGGEDVNAVNQVLAIYKGRFKYIEPIVTDSRTAELIKYALNAFFVTKVVFANSIAEIADEIGANYQTIRKVLMTHKWGSKNHFQVFHKNGKGAGGKCLPKDLEVLKNIGGGDFLETLYAENNYLLGVSGKE